MTLTRSWCHSFISQSCSRTSNWWLDWMAWRRKSAAKREGQDKIQNRAEQIGHSRHQQHTSCIDQPEAIERSVHVKMFLLFASVWVTPAVPAFTGSLIIPFVRLSKDRPVAGRKSKLVPAVHTKWDFGRVL
ncbi:hypothetical protein T09_6537 [Trichinella sp. T9]|nr:hypothetical protein T09_6537 [Trichinella sp. T9]